MPDSIVKANNITALDGTGVGIPDGTVASPGLKFTNDSDSGLYRIGANDIAIAVNGAKAFEADPNTVSIYTGGVERFRIESTGQIKAVYESQVGTDYNTTLDNGYFCRAWVNFDGSGTVAIRASGNVSSITDNGTGDYTINFTTSLPDANYSVCSADNSWGVGWIDTYNVNSIRTYRYNTNNFAAGDRTYITIGIFR